MGNCIKMFIIVLKISIQRAIDVARPVYEAAILICLATIIAWCSTSLRRVTVSLWAVVACVSMVAAIRSVARICRSFCFTIVFESSSRSLASGMFLRFLRYWRAFCTTSCVCFTVFYPLVSSLCRVVLFPFRDIHMVYRVGLGDV